MSADNIRIGPNNIGRQYPPFIVAEMSGNHNRSLERALAIVDAAAEAGAHAVKLQTYTADTMTLDIDHGDFTVTDPGSLWSGKSLYELYEEAATPWEWHQPIMDRCRQRGLECFSTPFDTGAVDFLEELDVPCYKIASFENTDTPLIRRIAATGKPIIMSTGMASITDLDQAVRTIRQQSNNSIILLKCTSSYPATPDHSNIRTIPHLRDLFGCQVGLSDHTLGIGVAVASVALGATFIEKHFTLSRAEGGVDATFSLEPAELKMLVEETRRAWQGLGRITYGAEQSEKKSIQFRRSLYVGQDMKQGETFTEENLRRIRPGFGLSPACYDVILGKKVARDVKKGTPVSWNLVG